MDKYCLWSTLFSLLQAPSADVLSVGPALLITKVFATESEEASLSLCISNGDGSGCNDRMQWCL